MPKKAKKVRFAREETKVPLKTGEARLTHHRLTFHIWEPGSSKITKK